MQNEEAVRLEQARAQGRPAPWLRWGSYLSERQWGTVREDYSAGGDAWSYFPHDHARSRAYRWGEDGLAGLCDDEQKLCFSIALWNGQDPILKERLFGLTNDEGNHGEDVKEYYFYLDNTPTHSYMKWLYKYPQRAFPYADLVQENLRRKRSGASLPEYELADTGVFADSRYFDVQVEYAKAGTDDILIRVRVTNRGPEAATLRLLPTLWFRNTWSWFEKDPLKPSLRGKLADATTGIATVLATPLAGDGEDDIGPMQLYCLRPDDLLFVENESNSARLWPGGAKSPYPKDGINDHVVSRSPTVNPKLVGTKASAVYTLDIAAGGTAEVVLRLSADLGLADPFGADFQDTFARRIGEADAFHSAIAPAGRSAEQLAILRQAYAGMLWSKQFYHYVVKDWLDGDANQPRPPAGRDRNRGWTHFYASHILSMPDAWEYPWFAAWDLCFQAVVLSRLDMAFAKEQLLILAREWYMSPAGAIPAYEWSFDDVNPPLHGWAALKILEVEKEISGRVDLDFLAAIFQYCLVYFAWWTNRKDPEGNDLFEGGFLGLDNIAVIDRSHLSRLAQQIGRGLELCQSDATSWMGLFCLNLVEMALALSPKGKEYTRLANKFLQYFVSIAETINGRRRQTDGEMALWFEDDGFYYDVLKVSGGNAPTEYVPLRLRSLVGIIALFPVLSIDLDSIEDGAADELRERIEWFFAQHPDLFHRDAATTGERTLLSFVQPDRLRRVLARVFDQNEFLSPHGIRSVSRAHLDPPYSVNIHGVSLTERYEPAESVVPIYGGNSNWRGPVWFPLNFLFIDTLRTYHAYLGDAFTIEYPSGSGNQLTLEQIARDLSQRLVSIFETRDGRRPVYGGAQLFQQDPHWKDLVLFYEYFHGDNGAGIGASHQTGWTGLIAELLRSAEGASQQVPVVRGLPQAAE